MQIDSPVGTELERVSGEIWPGDWIDATGFGTVYALAGGSARHTGADLNLNKPVWNADANAPIYAIADGIVTASHKGGGTWGWIIVIEHKDDNGNKFYSRSAHVNHIQYPVIQKDMTVKRGSVIAHIGDADGIFHHHLHFDISHSDVLKNSPEDWPGNVSLANLKKHYTDPREFILQNQTGNPTVDSDDPVQTMKVITSWLRIRPQPNTAFPEIGWLRYGDIVEVKGEISGSGYHFAELLKINDNDFIPFRASKGYAALEYLE